MEIFIDNMPRSTQRTAVALGHFDAMHIGHTAIIKKAVEHARECSMKSLVFLFENNPSDVILGKETKNINTLSKREEILFKLGVDMVFVKKFDADFMRLEAAEFVDSYIVKKFNAGFAAAGFNYRFGANAKGDTEFLRSECAERGIESFTMPGIMYEGETVSSTRIRKEISDGCVDTAARLMGRYYSVKGVVRRGNRLGGSVLGFPTANMDIPSDRVLPRLGVYVSYATVDGKRYPAISNIGEKPTVENNYPCIETHIDGSFNELYGKEIEVEFCKFIREIFRFESLDELKKQLAADKLAAREYFKNVNRQRKDELV